MKIKLALLDKDVNYLNRIAAVFTGKYSDKLEVYLFTDADATIAGLKSLKINTLVASDEFDIDMGKIPKNCGFAYFVESADIETYKERPTICKYQKAEMIYKNILEIFSENLSESIGIKFDSEVNVHVTAFVSASGGVGCSSAAAACAENFAAAGKRTLYLNLEQFGDTNVFFKGEGGADFGDVIFALKSKKTNMLLKLESNVKQDVSGVFFYSSPKTALDMAELNPDELSRLITDLKLTGAYDNIVIDVDFSLETRVMGIFRQSSRIIFVSDGSEIANVKLIRAHKAIEILEEQSDNALLPRISVFYNKFSNKTGQTLDDVINSIGGVPKYENATIAQVIAQLSSTEAFNKLY